MPDEIVQEVPAAVEPVATEVAAAPVGEPQAAPTETAAPPGEATPVAEPASEPTLLDRIEALPADALHLLHDALSHIHHGLTEVSLMTGMTRLGEILGHVKSKL